MSSSELLPASQTVKEFVCTLTEGRTVLNNIYAYGLAVNVRSLIETAIRPVIITGETTFLL